VDGIGRSAAAAYGGQVVPIDSSQSGVRAVGRNRCDFLPTRDDRGIRMNHIGFTPAAADHREEVAGERAQAVVDEAATVAGVDEREQLPGPNADRVGVDHVGGATTSAHGGQIMSVEGLDGTGTYRTIESEGCGVGGR